MDPDGNRLQNSCSVWDYNYYVHNHRIDFILGRKNICTKVLIFRLMATFHTEDFRLVEGNQEHLTVTCTNHLITEPQWVVNYVLVPLTTGVA